MDEKEFANYCEDLLAYRCCRAMIGPGCLWQAGIGPDGFNTPPCPYSGLSKEGRREEIECCVTRMSRDSVVASMDWEFQKYLSLKKDTK